MVLLPPVAEGDGLVTLCLSFSLSFFFFCEMIVFFFLCLILCFYGIELVWI